MDISQFEAELDQVGNIAEIKHTPCESGVMIWRCWNRGGGPLLVLFHGGSGSWSHWYRNIEALAIDHEVWVPDLPGLGDSDELKKGYDADYTANIVVAGLKEVLGNKSLHLIGFSWGACLSSIVASKMNGQISSLMLVGVAALGDHGHRTHMKPLLKRSRNMTLRQIWDTNRENLSRLMIHDPGRIDDMSVYLQMSNTNRSRFNSPQFARTTLTLDSLQKVTAPLYVIYGDRDAPAYPDFQIREAKLRQVRGDLAFEMVEGAGHWLAYEEDKLFNERAVDWVARNS